MSDPPPPERTPRRLPPDGDRRARQAIRRHRVEQNLCDTRVAMNGSTLTHRGLRTAYPALPLSGLFEHRGGFSASFAQNRVPSGAIGQIDATRHAHEHPPMLPKT